MKLLRGQVAVVAGATRGAGRGIAVSLGEAGATVYCTGRSTAGSLSPMKRPETIDETAVMVTEAGGKGIPVRVDHTKEEEVKALFKQVKAEQGKLDMLINDIWGLESLIEWGESFWTMDVEKVREVQQTALFTHLITSKYGAPLLIEQGKGIIVEVTDGTDYSYRGNLAYSLAKISTIHAAEAMAADLSAKGYNSITALSITPGFLRSEEMLERFGVREANWQEGAKVDADFIASETPYYVGRAVAALAADKAVHQFHGKALSSWQMMHHYNFTDRDGEQPDWGAYFEKKYGAKDE